MRTLVVVGLVAGDARAPAAAAAAAVQSSRSTEAKERCSSTAPLSTAAAAAAAQLPPPPNGVSCSCNSAPRACGTISSTHSSGGQPPSDAPKPTVPLSASAAALLEGLLVLVLVPPILLPPTSAPGSSMSRSSCFAVASDSRSAHALPRVVPCSSGALTRIVPPECSRDHVSSRAPSRDETRMPRSRSRPDSRPRLGATFSRSTTASATSRSSSSSFSN